jgi:iron-sulfur cluster assembly accessory protein
MIELTDNADIHLSSIIVDKNIPAIKLSVNSGGCSGFSYDWQLVSEEELTNFVDDFDFILDLDTGKLIIDSLSLIYLVGTVVDYKKDIFGQRLMVENPNINSMCGCGESFSVKDI